MEGLFLEGRRTGKWITLALAVILTLLLAGFTGKQSGLLLHLGFDEGSGNLVWTS